jgi:hypothetical protein
MGLDTGPPPRKYCSSKPTQAANKWPRYLLPCSLFDDGIVWAARLGAQPQQLLSCKSRKFCVGSPSSEVTAPAVPPNSGCPSVSPCSHSPRLLAVRELLPAHSPRSQTCTSTLPALSKRLYGVLPAPRPVAWTDLARCLRPPGWAVPSSRRVGKIWLPSRWVSKGEVSPGEHQRRTGKARPAFELLTPAQPVALPN